MGGIIGKKKKPEEDVIGIAKRRRKGSVQSSMSSDDSSSLAPSVSQGSSYQTETEEAARSASKSGESSIDDIELESHPSSELDAMNSVGTVNLDKEDDSEDSGDSTKPMQLGKNGQKNKSAKAKAKGKK
jgi:hypothetical protein